MESHSTEYIDETFARLAGFAERPAPDVRQRLELLRELKSVLRSSNNEICEAIHADFRKSNVEVELTEIATVMLELRSALSNLKRWASADRIRADFPFWTTRSLVVAQPKGIVLIISPWNYPLLLSLSPLVSAIAAGNRIILKPSERTPNTSALLAGLLDRALGPDWCVVIQGDAKVGAHLLTKPFNHFFFTGSPEIGRIVMKAAADHWSSATLELGGKSPAIVDDTADIGLAAEKIIIGKYLNAGQTCIAPDFVIAHESVFDELVQTLIDKASTMGDRHKSTITGIVDSRHAERLRTLWNDARRRGAEISDGPKLDLEKVSILTNVSLSARIMKEEIFGPLLPVLRYSSVADIVGVVSRFGAPLTCYLFTQSDHFAQDIRNRVKTGSICRNEMLLHFAHPNLPFGGVGKSGSGRTHGYAGFRAFSDEISVFDQRWGSGVLPLLFPVIRPSQDRLRAWFLRFLSR